MRDVSVDVAGVIIYIKLVLVSLALHACEYLGDRAHALHPARTLQRCVIDGACRGAVRASHRIDDVQQARHKEATKQHDRQEG
jgi:hypothetical protein